MKKKIVTIGGGNGSAITINSLKKYNDLFDISAVVSMSDSGGSSGRLRKEFNTLPPGDIMRAVLAMSKYDYNFLKNIFYKKRFNLDGKLNKHNLGNLFLVLGEKYSGDFVSPIRALEQSVEAVGRVYPATLDKTDLVAELSNGQVIKTEESIDRPNYDRNLKIKRAWLEPAGKVYFGAEKAIEEADFILMGPGSLYTSVVSALLPAGLKESIEKSKAKLIYIVGNAYETIGETGPEKLSEFVLDLQKYLPRKIDTVIYNNCTLSDRKIELYKERDWGIIEDDSDRIKDYNIVKADYGKDGAEEIDLSTDKLGCILQKVINILKK